MPLSRYESEAEKLSHFLALIGNDVWDVWRKLSHEPVLRYIRSTPDQGGSFRISSRMRGLTISAALLATLLAAKFVAAPWHHETDFFADRLDEFEPSFWT